MSHTEPAICTRASESGPRLPGRNLGLHWRGAPGSSKFCNCTLAKVGMILYFLFLLSKNCDVKRESCGLLLTLERERV